MELNILTFGTGYVPRTKANARIAQITLAFAVDFETAGELLTARCAGPRLIQVPLLDLESKAGAQPWIDSVTAMAANQHKGFFRDEPHIKILNVAGNGIRTLSAHGVSQEQADKLVLRFIKAVHKVTPIHAVRSGGQTGIDTSGLRAGLALNIPTTALMPDGYLIRTENSEFKQTEEQARARILGAQA